MALSSSRLTKVLDRMVNDLWCGSKTPPTGAMPMCGLRKGASGGAVPLARSGDLDAMRRGSAPNAQTLIARAPVIPGSITRRLQLVNSRSCVQVTVNFESPAASRATIVRSEHGGNGLCPI